MRAASAFAAVALTSTLAHAQPVTRPSDLPCRARVIEAPEPVRAEIERWVRSEPRCERELDVRVTRVAGGFHLVATDNEGRVRERVIPDAQSAAVLVVSWMADDAIDDGPAPVSPGLLAPVPVVPRLPVQKLELDSGSPALRRRAPLAPSRRHRWLGLGASGGDESIGVHAQLDLFAIGAWTLGIAGGWQTGERDLEMDDADVAVGDATLFAAYTWSLGRVDVRAQLGLGAALEATSMMGDDVSVLPKGQAGAFLRVRVGEPWGLLGGPLVDVTPHSLGVSAFVGLERRL